jgi:hypothetical protein
MCSIMGKTNKISAAWKTSNSGGVFPLAKMGLAFGLLVAACTTTEAPNSSDESCAGSTHTTGGRSGTGGSNPMGVGGHPDVGSGGMAGGGPTPTGGVGGGAQEWIRLDLANHGGFGGAGGEGGAAEAPGEFGVVLRFDGRALTFPSPKAVVTSQVGIGAWRLNVNASSDFFVRLPDDRPFEVARPYPCSQSLAGLTIDFSVHGERYTSWSEGNCVLTLYELGVAPGDRVSGVFGGTFFDRETFTRSIKVDGAFVAEFVELAE